MRRPSFYLVISLLVIVCGSAVADQIAINPSKDNTLYESAAGGLSNGAGEYLFAGRTYQSSNAIRRALLAFDVAGSVPAGSTIDSVTLTLNMSRAFSEAPRTVSLHGLLADWGEGTSDAGGEEGMGTTATTNDATWIYTFYNSASWTTAGGDYSVAVSASTSVNAVGSYTWGSTAQMVSDVQVWLDSPASSFGWALVGNEGSYGAAKRFDSGEHATANNRPLLTINYTAVPEPATILLLATGIVTMFRRRERWRRTRP